MDQLGILIPFYNMTEYVMQVLESIPEHTRNHILLIDNGSKTTQEQRERLRSIRRNTTVEINEQNMGVSYAWNQGIRRLFENPAIDKVAVLNNDIILHSQCLMNLEIGMAENNVPLMTATDRAAECSVPHDIVTLPLAEREFVNERPEFSCFMITRAGYQDIGKFDEKFYPAYFEDNDYHYRGKLKRYRFLKINTAIYYHFGSRTLKENKDVGESVSTHFLQNEAYYVEKWGGKPGQEKFTRPFNDSRNG